MQDQKMLRFLNSIHIDNVDDFDLAFEMINRNRFNNEQWDMVIVKKSPWSYKYLRQFQDGLNTIKYPYLLRFSYMVRPGYDDVRRLFEEWYQTLYRLPPNIELLDGGDDHLKIEYTSESEKEQYQNIIEDFRDFLTFINYEFTITESVMEIEEDTPDISKRAMKKIVEAAEEEAVDSMETLAEMPEAVDRNDVLEMLEEERKELNSIVEDSLLKIMKENAIQMKKERERARLNKRGNYIPVDNIDSINANSGSVDFNGTIFSLEKKDFGNKSRLNIGVADDEGGAIYVNMYENAAVNKDFIDKLLNGTNLRVRGVAYLDEFNKTLNIKGHFLDLLPPEEILKEEYPVNRVELHLHSNMSYMDGVTPIGDFVKLAKQLGHKAIGLTDHADLQAYPDAQKAAKKSDIKMLYGVEMYMIDSKLKFIQNPCNTPLNKAKYVVLDLETTGLSCRYNKIIEFGAVCVEHGTVTRSIDILINPEVPINYKITELTGIDNEMLKGKPTLKEAMPEILEFLGDAILVTHNTDFDISFLQEKLKELGLPPLTNPIIDTLALSRYLFPESRRHTLGALCRNMDVNYDEESAHRADYDATVLNEVLQPMLVLLTKKNHNLTHAELANLETPTSVLQHLRPKHVIAYAKNLEGLKALNKLVSLSHVEYFSDIYKLPFIPREEINKRRENLLLGSACFNGDVFDTARTRNKDELKRIISFYDYIEIQPLENYSYLVNMGDLEEEEVIQYVKDIVECAEEENKLVVATGDVHYLTRKEKVFRDVYIGAKGLGGTPHPLNPYARSRVPRFENPDQHYRTTKEMLDCMSFLGEEKAFEFVVTNTNRVADMIEAIVPLPNDKLYPPKVENCENMLKDLVYGNAHKLYGDPLPQVIQERLDTELNGIISNGYSVIYYFAHKIVKKTNDDGFIVGSRGSVGSSLAATMAGITEVNPLPPHYICPHCHHLEWTSETMPDYKSGYDLPDKKCPICGQDMIHDGQNIPFQTFLGFKAEKTPDIDLNFPADYQSKAHDYTKELLGEDNVFRAGTIETVADKTAFGYARGYIERLGLDPDTYSRAKIAYLASGCIGVKRTTGQHPGGIVVVPSDHQIYDFMPVQYPADDVNSGWKTTHYDFHSFDETLLKFDMLGHVDPMALKMMCDLTNIKVSEIPMNDQKVVSIFSSPAALGIKNDYLGNKTGAMAIPEFGTDFVRGVLEDTRPKSFSDLVIISGITHGTDVWQGNAEKLIKDGITDLRGVIGCRDDIMTFLISKGLPDTTSFAIMEDVRHGKGLKSEYVDIMKANGVKQYYIDSCNKIKYLFPKGHAVAYVTMAMRVGYFKVYYPLEFYATFFSVRSKQYDIKAMIGGREAIVARLEELKLKSKSKTEKMSPKEVEQLKTLNVALEMVQRGFKFENIDLNRSEATVFVVDKENNALIPPFATIDGLGENNAFTVVEARKDGPFYSKEDLLRRTKLTSTNVQDLDDMGVLKDLSDTDQLSLFDF